MFGTTYLLPSDQLPKAFCGSICLFMCDRSVYWILVSTITYKPVAVISPNLHHRMVTKMNQLDFEVKRSKIKVTARPNALVRWRHMNPCFTIYNVTVYQQLVMIFHVHLSPHFICLIEAACGPVNFVYMCCTCSYFMVYVASDGGCHISVKRYGMFCAVIVCGPFLWGCIPPQSSIQQVVHSKCSFWQYGFQSQKVKEWTSDMQSHIGALVCPLLSSGFFSIRIPVTCYCYV